MPFPVQIFVRLQDSASSLSRNASESSNPLQQSGNQDSASTASLSLSQQVSSHSVQEEQVEESSQQEILSETSLPILNSEQPYSSVAFTLYLTQEQFFQLITGNLSLQGQPPASEEALKSQLQYTKAHDPNSSCGICLEEFGELEIAQMPCGHSYHKDCLTTWLKNSNTCPHCRFEVLTDNEDYNRGVIERMSKRKIVQIDGLNEPESSHLEGSPLKRSKSVSQLSLNTSNAF